MIKKITQYQLQTVVFIAKVGRPPNIAVDAWHTDKTSVVRLSKQYGKSKQLLDSVQCKKKLRIDSNRKVKIIRENSKKCCKINNHIYRLNMW